MNFLIHQVMAYRVSLLPITLLFLLPLFASAQPVKAGFILPLSGEYAWVGTEVARGLEIAKDASPELELIIEDAATQSPAQVVSAARRLLEVTKVSVLSVLTVDDAEPIAPILHGKDAPLLVLWESSERLLEMGDTVFSSGFSLEETGESLVRAASADGLTRVALVAHHTPWAETMFGAFRRHAKKYSLTIVSEEMLPLETREYRAVISRIKSKKPESVFVAVAVPSAIATFLKESRELGLQARFLTGEAFVGDGVRIAGKDAEGVIAPWPGTENEGELRRRYLEKYGKEPIDVGAVGIGFDGGRALIAAMQLEGDTLLARFRRYFGPARSLKRAEPLHVVRGGKLEPLDYHHR